MEKGQHDKDISDKMRNENYEQFKTLCRMHLSFELDLNTDEFDLPCHEVIYYEKGKLKKWNRLSKKMKTCTSGVKNSPLEVNQIHLTLDMINQLRQLKDFLMRDENIIQEGIFRRTGAVSRQNDLRMLINKGDNFDLNANYTVHDCATVYKSFLAELPEPLLTDAHYPAHCQIAELCNGLSKTSPDNKKDQHILNSVQLLVLLLPEENRVLLEDIVTMLNTAASYEISNKMSANTLATLFSPHLICPRNLPPEALHYVSQTMNSVISFMISKGLQIFEIPAKLATDIRAHYHEVKRKKTMSPEQTLDESISDISTVNTVYTFVDREKTAAAHNSNPTDTALAQLYAHIQSLPESSKKRKLIKQFNKENGQGTPLQILMVNRVKNSETNRSTKSISDSIKKHIFNKGLISKTPKRTNTLTTGNFSTPNGAPKNPKLRVLFQSPISILSPSTTVNKYQQQIQQSITPLSSSSSSSSSSTLKSHPLQKSISSSSLTTTTKPSISTNNNLKKETVSSAPISRVGSSDLESIVDSSENLLNPSKYSQKDLCETTTKYFEINKPILTTDSEKSVWNEKLKGNSIIAKKLCDTKLKYKSEPNLSRMNEKTTDEKYSNGLTRQYLKTRKLIKGFSMTNLRNTFTTPITVKSLKKIIEKTSSTPDLYSSDGNSSSDLIDYFKENSNKEEMKNRENVHNLNIYRNIDLITSTPAQFLGRRSMSPITKSTQRMPKAMQESIMTPRSRKPVMLMATMLGSSEQNQSTFQSDLTKFNEQDEDSFLSNELLLENSVDNCKENKLHKLINDNGSQQKNKIISTVVPDALTNTFREYLLSRSVLTASPEDSSFSSQSDDFAGGSTTEIQDINESQMSTSLLYCLDGNEPIDDDFEKQITAATTINNCDNNGVVISNNTRKRSSYQSDCCNDIDYTDHTNDNIVDYQQSLNAKQKKLLVIKENPGETSL